MTSKHPYTLSASISLYHLLFVHRHVFPLNISPCVEPETRGHLCLSMMGWILPSRCCTKSPFSKWLEWMRGHSIWGRRTMQALAVMELAFSPFMSRGGPFAQWKTRKANTGLLQNELFCRPHDFAFSSWAWMCCFISCLTFWLFIVHCSLSLSPPFLLFFSVPLATVSKVPIPKGWRRGPVMSCMHNSTPVIYVLLSHPLHLCHSFLSLMLPGLFPSIRPHL